MIPLAIPVVVFLVLHFIARVFCRRNIFHPAVMLSAAYLVMAVVSIIYAVMTDAWQSISTNAAAGSTLMLGLLITASLVPSLLIKKPDLDLELIRRTFGRWSLGIAAIAGIAGFVCLLSVFIASLSIDADSSKSLGETASLVAGTPFVVVGSFLSAFSCVFGLLLFCDTKWELNWMLRIGIGIGFLNYGIMMECNKGREAAVYYPFFMVFYLWMFGRKWQRKMKVFYYTCLVLMMVVGGALFTVKTTQRFGHQDAWSLSVVDGTVGYLGQQITTFIEMADEREPMEGHAEMAFPVYFFLVNGEWVDVLQLLSQRTRVIEWSFGTYVGTFYLAIGRQWTIATLLVLAVLAGVFFSRTTKRFPGTYVIGIMLYYQTLFQGVFYWQQGGRFGNGFIIGMVGLGLALYCKDGLAHRGQGAYCGTNLPGKPKRNRLPCEGYPKGS